MGKQRPDQPAPAAPAAANPFAALASLRSTLPGGASDGPAAASAGDSPFAAKLVIARERKGRGGKTATLVRGVALTGEALETFAREMRQALGTGGGVEGEAIVLAGDQSDRAAQWLRARGATRIVIGN
ncbi:MAG: translation initiation factor [Pseudomonadales bacterium]|nr:translation initiation factor [Pseudomonadales bacterium]